MLDRRTLARLATSAVVALAFGGAVLALGSYLGAPLAEEPPSVHHLGGGDAPAFATVDELHEAVEDAGITCPTPTPIADPYATYASDLEYPPTQAARCSVEGGSVVLFVYENMAGRIDAHEQAIIGDQACASVPERDLPVSHSVAGANWRVTSVGTARAVRLVDAFDGDAVEEPFGCLTVE